MLGGDLETLLQRVVLGRASIDDEGLVPLDHEYAIARAIATLEAREELEDAQLYQLRLRLAMHLAPREALAYDPLNLTQRHVLIQQYLERVFERRGDLVDRLARDVALVLRSWEEERRSVTTHAASLLRKQQGRCAHCQVRLAGNPSPHSLIAQDDYKPYYLSPSELLAPEVDHIDSVSTYGTNDYENLQVLCRLCNFGKGDGLGLSLKHEATYSGTSIRDVPRSHRCAMVYAVIERAKRQCALCGEKDLELTIRPRQEEGGYIRTNLMTICEVCLGVHTV